MKWLIIILSITSFCFNKAVSQSISPSSKEYFSAADSEEIRKHPSTAPIFYKDVKPEASLDTGIFKRKYSPADASLPNAAPPSAPVSADTRGDYPKPRAVKAGEKNLNAEPAPPVFKPR
jgi:hypothetical protein